MGLKVPVRPVCSTIDDRPLAVAHDSVFGEADPPQADYGCFIRTHERPNLH